MAMPSTKLCILLFLCLITIAEATLSSNLNISLGSSISPANEPTAWFSPSGHFAFGFYPEGSGFRIGVWLLNSQKNKTVIWTANRDDDPLPNDALLKFTTEGLEVIQKNTEQNPIYAVDEDAFSASMLDTGNFIISDKYFRVIWQTFDNPTDTIVSGQSLSAPNELVSSISETDHSSGKFRIKMQVDGNVVMYPVGTKDDQADAYYATNTEVYPYDYLNLNDEGMLYLTASTNTSTRYTLTSNKSTDSAVLYRATIDMDGIFRLYSHDLNSSTIEVFNIFPEEAQQCTIKGSCGVNSYCNSMDNKLECFCLPNFDFIDDKITSSGCKRNTSIHGCPSENRIRMQYITNTVWQNDFYDSNQTQTDEACENECLEDCNCEVAIYDDGICYKQKLPLKYGYREKGSSTITFIKIGNSTGEIERASEITVIPERKFSIKYFCISIVVTAVFLLLLFSLSFFLYRHRALRYEMLSRSRELDLVDGIAPRSFSYDELKHATDSFKEELGKGSFGTVFKGVFARSERTVAIKKLGKIIEQGEKEFRAEIKAIGSTHHRNLVKLLGFCDEGSDRLLVYEYMRNGSLADMIFNREKLQLWEDRKRILLDIVRGLNYLHEECENRIIHCDIKPQNILMDDNWIAKISDFGLAKLLMPSQTRTFTEIRGTRGYLAPEWHKSAPVTVKADVYSFGVVLLETICCRQNMELEAEAEEIMLLPWVYSCFLAGEVEKLVPDEVDKTELNKFVKVGLWCTQFDPTSRPTMKNVMMMLEGSINIPVPPAPVLIF